MDYFIHPYVKEINRILTDNGQVHFDIFSRRLLEIDSTMIYTTVAISSSFENKFGGLILVAKRRSLS